MNEGLVIYAAEMDTVPQAAFHYVRAGLSILPCDGKTPAVRTWRNFQRFRPTLADVKQWDRCGELKNVGIICGHVSDNLAVIDLDGIGAIETFYAEFPYLLDTYTVTSGSGFGAHLYLRCLKLPPTTRALNLEFGNIELRANGCYVIAPPSVHPATGARYFISHRKTIKTVHDLNAVVDWLHSLMRPLKTSVREAATVGKVTRWAQSALREECNAVIMAQRGSRNAALNRAAFKLGQIVAMGDLTRGEVERALHNAAAELVRDDGLITVERTIKSGIDAGVQNPRGRR